jgi:phosphoribosylformylglycinamidine cyclo-ligase
MKTRGLTYRNAGVDIDAKMSAIASFSKLARSTFSASVLNEIGSFGGLFDLSATRIRRPVLVGSMDGVGTKLKVAFLTGRHDTVGRDLVNHCVNDILVQGARPLFFLDYLATGMVRAGILESVVSGIAAGCRENGCALIGGETAEMPGFYRPGEYDLAGCIVGIVDRRAILDGSGIRPGDRILGLRSSGLHTNGYSLARKVLFDRKRLTVRSRVAGLRRPLGEELLAVHRTYLPLLEPLLPLRWIRGMAHITGGGFADNIPRILPPGCAAEIHAGSWRIPAIFRVIQQAGSVSDTEMRRTFNLGIGMVVVASPSAARRIRARLARTGEPAPVIGRIVAGPRRVVFREDPR